MSDYNGWKNYETWNVALWLSNDEGIYIDTRQMAQEAVDAYTLADTLRDYVDDLAEMTCPGSRSGASFVCDLLGAALSDVDWHEIAENLRSDMEVDA